MWCGEGGREKLPLTRLGDDNLIKVIDLLTVLALDAVQPDAEHP
jgi:hypothetical protein